MKFDQRYYQESVHESDAIKYKFRPNHLLLSAAFAVVLLIVTLLADASVIYQFLKVNRIRVGFTSLESLAGFGILSALLIALDLVTPAVALALKRRIHKVEKTPMPLILLGIGGLLVLIVVMFSVRLSLVTPESIERGTQTVPSAIVFGLAPILTTVGSTIFFWISYHPLAKEMENLLQRRYSCQKELVLREADRAKYPEEDVLRERLVKEQFQLYLQTVHRIEAMASKYKLLFRTELAKKLGTPLAATVLSDCEPSLQTRPEVFTVDFFRSDAPSAAQSADSVDAANISAESVSVQSADMRDVQDAHNMKDVQDTRNARNAQEEAPMSLMPADENAVDAEWEVFRDENEKWAA